MEMYCLGGNGRVRVSSDRDHAACIGREKHTLFRLVLCCLAGPASASSSSALLLLAELLAAVAAPGDSRGPPGDEDCSEACRCRWWWCAELAPGAERESGPVPAGEYADAVAIGDTTAGAGGPFSRKNRKSVAWASSWSIVTLFACAFPIGKPSEPERTDRIEVQLN